MEGKSLTFTDIQASVKDAILTNDIAVYRALKILYSFQTASEQRSGETIEDNGVGFNGRDAGFCTSVYQSWQKYGNLTDKQITALRKILPKYSRQLTLNAIASGFYEALPQEGRTQYYVRNLVNTEVKS
jgi:hypothetical protein